MTVVNAFSELKMLWKVYFWSFFCDPTSSDSTIWHRIHRMNFQPRHFDKNNKMLHFRARHDGIFEHKLLDILKNLLLIRVRTAIEKRVLVTYRHTGVYFFKNTICLLHTCILFCGNYSSLFCARIINILN